MKLYKYPDKSALTDLLQRPETDTSRLEETVSGILQDVKKNGDDAVRKYTLQFDKTELADFRVTEAEFSAAEPACPEELKAAIQQARENIYKFHKSQQEAPQVIETQKGVQCWRKSVGIEKVGLYIPGGTAPLFSTVLMLAVPAQIAGCREIVLCSPPGKDGNLHPAILYTAKLCGVTQVYKIGGVQAIAAMAYGTETIPQVNKIFGPGNRYVTTAKQLVSKDGISIDLPAGPSEVLVYADDTANPEFVAADLLSQAEHDTESQVILVSESEALIDAANDAVKQQLEKLPRKAIAEKALENSKAFLVKDTNNAIDLINTYAPEHLIISHRDEDAISEKIINAGSVFIGAYTPESAGDYASGTNHTLPTNGYAKAYSGLSLDSFVKKITFQKITPEGLKNIGKTVEIMAAAEGLEAHKNAVSVRLRNLEL